MAADDDFYAPGPLRHLATNLFNGWGYNFYREENQLRADDQLVRAKASWLIGEAARSLDAAESDYRRRNLAPPTRAQPYPDPAAVAGAQALERLARSVGALVGRIQAQPAPESDRMTQRYRNEAATLRALGDQDALLVGQCELLRSKVAGLAGEAILTQLAMLETGVAAIEATLRDRAGMLQDRTD